MSNVDERIVQMQFDNKQFESGIQTSMKSLDNLKKSLNFDKSAKGFSDLEKAAGSVSLSGLQASVDLISSRFTNLGIVGVTALQNITNSAIYTGKRIAESLTIAPILTGFDEYETKMRSITTILTNTQSKGTTLDDVNAALEELNKYADQTIYNFAEMTRNIGTFTAAGVDLETSTKAIKGIANLAAGSGSSAYQASTAMYQLSQALAAGRVGLQDWNSVVNAGMGGEMFQNALKETAKQMGIIVDESVSFRESISGGDSWITSDVLVKTLERFAEDESLVKAATQVRTLTQLFDTLAESVQSGWAQSWEIIIGDSEEAAELFTALSDAIGGFFGEMADSRNAVLEGALTSNWDKLLKKINEADISTEKFSETVKEIARNQGVDVEKMIDDYGSLEEAFTSGAISSDVLKEALSNLGKTVLDVDGTFKRGDGLANSSEDVRKLQEALQDAGYELSQFGADGKYGKETEAAVKAFQEAQGIVADGIVGPETLSALKDASGSTVTFSDTVYELAGSIDELSGRELLLDGLRVAFSNLSKVFNAIQNGWERVFPPKSINEKVTGLRDLIQSFHDFAESIDPSEETLEKIERTFAGLFSVVRVGKQALTALVGGFFDLLRYVLPLGDGVLTVTASFGDLLTTFGDVINQYGVFEAVVTTATDAFGFLISYAKTGFSYIERFVTEFTDGLTFPDLRGFTVELSGMEETLDSIKSSASSGFSTATERIEAFVNGVENAITQVKAFGSSVKDFLSPIGEEIKNAFSGVTITDAVGTGLIAGIALGIRKFLNSFDEVTSSLSDVLNGVNSVLEGTREALEAWQNSLKAETLLKIAAAVGILTVSLMAMTTIDGQKLASGLAAVSVLLGEVVGTMALLSKFQFGSVERAAVSMVIISGAISILASALSSLKEFESWDDTWPALVAVSALMAGLTVSAKVLSSSVHGGELIKASAGLVIFSAAIKQLATSLESFSELSTDEIQKSLITLGGILGEIALFIKVANFSDLGNGRAAIIEIATSMLLMYQAVKLFGSLDPNVLSQGFLSASGMLLELATAMRMIGSVNMKGVGIALLSMATALTIMLVPIKTLGSMDLESLAKGIGSISVVLVAMGAAIAILQNFSAGAAAVGAGLLIMATALTVLIVPISALSLIPFENLISGLTAFVAILATLSATAILLSPFSLALVAVAGAFSLFGVAALSIGAGVAALSAGFASLAALGAAGATAIVAALGVILTGISALAPQIVSVITVGIGGMAEAIAMSAPEIGNAIVVIGQTVLSTIGDLGPQAIELVVSLLTSLVSTIADHAPEFFDSAFDIITSFLEGVASHIGDIVQAGIDIVVNFLNGISEKLPEVIDAGFNLMISFITGLADSTRENMPLLLEAIGELAAAIIEGLANGILGGIGRVGEAITNVGSSIVGAVEDFFDINSPSVVMTEEGQYIVDGLAEGIKKNMSAEEAAEKKAQNILNAFQKIFDELDAKAERADLELELWEAMYGDSASEADRVAEKVESLTEKVNLQTERVSLAQGKYENMLREFGETSSETQDAYNDLLKQQIELSNLQEELASAKIPDLSDRFSDIDIKSERADLELQLWESLYGENANEMEKAGAEATNLAKKVSAQTEKVSLAQERYEAVLKEFGSTSEEVAQAYNELLEQQIELSDLANELNEARYIEPNLTVEIGADIKGFNDDDFTQSIDKIKRDAYSYSSLDGTSLGTLVMGVSNAIPELQNSGSSMMSGLATGVSDNGDELSDAFSDAIWESIDYANDEYDSYYNTGLYLVEGFANGILAGKSTAIAAAVQMAQESLQAAKTELGVASPSKAFMALGRYSDEGFAIGLLGFGNLVTDASKTVGHDAVLGMKKSLIAMSDMVEDGMNATPTIRPVMDLSDIQAGMGRVNSMMSAPVGIRLSPATLSGLNYRSMASSLTRKQEQIQNGSPDVVEAIESLGERVDAMGRAISNMRVVMDTGATVGQLEGTMDRRLGMIAARKERGI